MAATSNDELAVTYAALVLHDGGVPVTSAAISAVLKAADVEVEPYWPSLFERVLKTKSLDDLILNAGAAPAPSAGPAATGGAAPASAGAKEPEKPKEEEKPESEDMGFDLFG